MEIGVFLRTLGAIVTAHERNVEVDARDDGATEGESEEEEGWNDPPYLRQQVSDFSMIPFAGQPTDGVLYQGNPSKSRAPSHSGGLRPWLELPDSSCELAELLLPARRGVVSVVAWRSGSMPPTAACMIS